MKAKFMPIVVFLLLMASCFIGVLLSDRSKAVGNYIYVDSAYHIYRDGTAEYPLESIQEAIDMAEPGDTIYVFGGEYDEYLVIDKKLKLWGSIERGPSIIQSRFQVRYFVEITADQVEFIGFTVNDTRGILTSPIGALIALRGNNIVVQSCCVNHSNAYGIFVDPSSHGNFISGNVFNDTKKGLYISSSHTNDIFDNYFGNCTETSIELSSCDTVRLYDNVINCAEMSTEKVNNKYVTVYTPQYKNGIVVKDSIDINISGNSISYSISNGIFLDDNTNDIIFNNTLNGNIGNGIFIRSANGRVIGNTFFNNSRAISLSSSNFDIYDNFILSSTGTGIYADSTSRSNNIYHNAFDDNFKSAQEFGDNYWYEHSLLEGNNWSDYNDVDLEPDGSGDGIGDVYYNKGGVLDKYPIGLFLKYPDKPTKPSPGDLETEVGLEITLSVDVNDPNDLLLNVYFYNANTDELIQPNAIDRKVESKASYTFFQGFDTTFAWYAVADNGKLSTKSDVWIFSTRAAPPENDPPVIQIDDEFEGFIDDSLVLDASDSYDPDGEIIFYRWNFGDGTSEILSSSPSHVYSSAGIYTVTLTIVDDNRTCTTDTTTVKVYGSEKNRKPVPNIGGPYVGETSEQITFDGSQSYDEDGSIANYTWDFGDGNHGYGVAPKHSYSLKGTYTVILMVTDDFGEKVSSSTSVIISSSETPGFELLIAIFAILLLLLWKKTR